MRDQKKNKKKKHTIDLRDSGDGRSADPVTQAGPWGALSAHSFTPQVGGSSRHHCSVAAVSTCLSASITVEDAAWGGKQDPGLRRVSRRGAQGRWLVRPPDMGQTKHTDRCQRGSWPLDKHSSPWCINDTQVRVC